MSGGAPAGHAVDVSLAVLTALAGATAFAVGAVMEHRAASSVPVDRGAAGPGW